MVSDTKHHRRSIRLKDFDYSQAGAYFITICTQDRICLFGEIVDDGMRLDDADESRTLSKLRDSLLPKLLSDQLRHGDVASQVERTAQP
ncbi:MAG: hypothetical protein LBV29_00055 [Azoarcus sp.]|jgi:hypothetical protein|nr:hypothetical protein [Azoarcus sp.]